jgi:hypothetical protein
VWDFDRKDFCSTCPQRYERERFREEADAVFAERFGESFKYDFHRLQNLVIEIAGLEGKTNLTVYSSALLNTFLNERFKFERFKDAQKPNG